MKKMRFFMFCALVPALVIAACSTDTGLERVLGVTAEAPVFLDYNPVSSTEMTFNFSMPVRVVSLNFDPAQEVASVTDGSEVAVSFAGSLEAGCKITADILVEDSDKNTLNVIVPFRARNDRMPAMVFNELRTEYSKTKTKVNTEFVEFLVREAGNLGAVRLFIAGYSPSKPVYEFAPAEVKAGEYVVLHLRTMEEGCADETETELSLSAGTDAQPDARDLWLPGAEKVIHKTDALWLADQDDNIIDAVLLCEKPESGWGKEAIAGAVEFLGGKRAWFPARDGGAEEDAPEARGWIPGPPDAVISSGTTATRTICRDETLPPERRAANWYITATSSSTPGKPNNPKRYAAK